MIINTNLEVGKIYRVNLTDFFGIPADTWEKNPISVAVPSDSLFLILELSSYKLAATSGRYWDLILTFNDRYPSGIKLFAPLQVGYTINDFSKLNEI